MPPAALEALVARFDPSALDGTTKSGRVRLEVRDGGAHDAVLDGGRIRLESADGAAPDALITGPAEAWERAAAAEEIRVRGLRMRHNLSLAIGFLAATSGDRRPGRLVLRTVDTPLGPIASVQAGEGPLLLAIHGLGGTKASFLTTLGALSDQFRVVAIDLPGFGDSVKPLPAAYDARFFARAVGHVLDALGAERADLVGNSMGGRVALEVALRTPERARRLVLLSPAMAWLRPRRWAPLLRFVRPELGALPHAPRVAVEPFVRRLVPGGDTSWTAAAVDEFLRAYTTPRGRYAFYAVARNIYLDEPRGERGMWTRLAELEHPALFVWGRRDQLVPIGFMRHVERALPSAEHLELDCGHVPQVERARETHAAMRRFLS